MPKRDSKDANAASSKEDVIARAKRRFTLADKQIADIKQDAVREKRRAGAAKKEDPPE
jgi:hypothetical protein